MRSTAPLYCLSSTVCPAHAVITPGYISQVVDIEENVWAPKYGLKGMVDASLSAAFQQPQLQSWLQSANQPQNAKPSDVMVPLEFKTGKPHVSHRAQVHTRRCPDAVQPAPCKFNRHLGLCAMGCTLQLVHANLCLSYMLLQQWLASDIPPYDMLV